MTPELNTANMIFFCSCGIITKRFQKNFLAMGYLLSVSNFQQMKKEGFVSFDSCTQPVDFQRMPCVVHWEESCPWQSNLQYHNTWHIPAQRYHIQARQWIGSCWCRCFLVPHASWQILVHKQEVACSSSFRFNGLIKPVHMSLVPTFAGAGYCCFASYVVFHNIKLKGW